MTANLVYRRHERPLTVRSVWVDYSLTSPVNAMRDNIISASVRTLSTAGLMGWSLQQVATEAGCAKGLVIHYFGTKASLLLETGDRIATVRAQRRLQAVGTRGTVGIDRLWQVITEDTALGTSAAALALASHGIPSRRPGDPAELHAALARCLGIPGDSLAEPLALAAMLEGIELQLVRGTPVGVVRAAFDRLWLTLIE